MLYKTVLKQTGLWDQVLGKHWASAPLPRLQEARRGMQVVFDLRENYNIFCSIVVYPVIPKGQLLLRLIPTSMHTLEDVKYTIKAFKNVAEKLAKGEYNKELLIDASKL